MKIEDMSPTIIVIMIIGFMLGVGLLVLGTFQSTAFTALSDPLTETILTNDTYTLNQTPAVVSTMAVFNNTWIDFDGTNSDYITVADAADLSIAATGNYTVSYWINPATMTFEGSSASGYREILGKGGTGENEFAFRFHNSSVSGANTTLFLAQDLAGSSASTTRSAAINAGEWSMITGTVNATHIDVYTNGDVSDSDTYSVTLESGTDDLFIGTKTAAGSLNFLNGSLDNVKISSQPVDPKIIKKNYREHVYGSNWGTGIPVLSYHIIKADAGTDSTTVNTSVFNATMIWLSDNGYETVDHADYLAYRAGTAELPAKPIIIEFDDGHESVIEIAYPILEEKGFTAILYILTNRTALPAVYTTTMNWSEVQTLYSEEWEINSHGVTHTDFLTLSAADRITQFNDSYNAVLGNISVAPNTFQYPFNGNNVTTDNECSVYYTMCDGFGSVDIATRLDTYLYKAANLTHEDGSPIGTRRNSMHNDTTLLEIQSLLIEDWDVMVQNFNENEGTVTHDDSDSGNNGAITGTTWVTDGLTIELLDGTDYSIATNILTILKNDYSWAQINTSYTYRTTNDETGFQALQSVRVGLATFADWIAIIVVVIAAAIVLGVVLFSMGRARNSI